MSDVTVVRPTPERVTVTTPATRAVVVTEPAATVVIRAPGPQGPPGAASAGLRYVHTQTTPAATWVIPHGLGRIPSVVLLDPDGQEFDADVLHPSLDTTSVVHGQPTAGTAHLST
jgi:hypothetical protein